MAAKILPDADYLRQCFSYEPDTGVLRWNSRPQEHFTRSYEWLRWNGRYAGKPCGHASAKYIIVTLDGLDYPAHKLIWKLVTSDEPQEIDHRDRNKTNNRWMNLRPATHAENCRNRKRRKASNLPVGVQRNGAKFTAYIGFEGTRHYLGIFETVEEAGDAYVDAALRLHKDFAAINH